MVLPSSDDLVVDHGVVNIFVLDNASCMLSNGFERDLVLGFTTSWKAFALDLLVIGSVVASCLEGIGLNFVNLYHPLKML
jgi:hypothetical protein